MDDEMGKTVPMSRSVSDGAMGGDVTPREELPAEEKWATWEDLCEGGRVVEKYDPRVGAKIAYTTYIPLDEMLRLQGRHGMMEARGQRDSKGFLVSVLKAVLVRPKVTTPEHERLLLKSNAFVCLGILGEVMSENSEVFKAVVEDLGE